MVLLLCGCFSHLIIAACVVHDYGFVLAVRMGRLRG